MITIETRALIGIGVAGDADAVTGSQRSRGTAERVAAQLTDWPGLETGRPSCGIGRAFGHRGAQILHLHTAEEADLRLSRSFIGRLDRVLTDGGQVVVRPGDDWVTVRLDTDTAGSLLISLTSLAMQAVDETAPAQPCTRERPDRPAQARAGRLAAGERDDDRPRPLRRLRPLRHR